MMKNGYNEERRKNMTHKEFKESKQDIYEMTLALVKGASPECASTLNLTLAVLLLAEVIQTKGDE